MIKITGIIKGHSPESFMEELILENSNITTTFGSDVKNKFRFITKKDCRNNRKENWIFQTTPEIFKFLMKSKNLTFDLCTIYIEEYTNISMCFKCCSYGHMAKHCTVQECCCKCSGAHDGRQCTQTTLECPNCKKLGITNRGHSARNQLCPAYQQRIDKLRRYTNYSTESLDNFLSQTKQ